jgi:hypothetical protein
MVKSCSNNSSPNDKNEDEDGSLLTKRDRDIFDTKRITFNSTFGTQEDDIHDSNQRQYTEDERRGQGGELVISNNNNDSSDPTSQSHQLTSTESRDPVTQRKFDDVEVASSSARLACISKMSDTQSDINLIQDFALLRNAIQSMVSPEQKGNLDKIYHVMDQIRLQQLKNLKETEKLRSEKNKKKSRARIYFVLIILFVLLFTLLNLAASFGAVYFLQQMKISSNDELVSSKEGQIIATTSKVVSFTMDSSKINVNTTRGGRRLTTHRLMKDYCPETDADTNKTATTQCSFIGTMKQSHAIRMFQSFCPSWPKSEKCTDSGLPFVHLTCGNIITKIYGGIYLPPGPPASWTSREKFTLFPTQDQGYYGEQAFSKGQGNGVCVNEFDIAMYCPADKTPCLVFAAYEINKCNAGRPMICKE